MLIIICLITMLLLNIFTSYIPFLSYADEFIPFLFLLLYIVKLIKNNFSKRIEKNKIVLIILLCLIFFIGVYANYKFKYNNGTTVILKDFIAFYKMFIMIISLDYLVKGMPQKYYQYFTTFCYAFVGVLFACLVINLFSKVNWFSSGEYRLGIKSYKFLFSHPTFLVASTVPLLMIIHLSERKYRKLFIFLTLVITLSTLRTKGLIIVILYLIICAYQQIKGIFTKSSFRILRIALFGFACIALYIVTIAKITEYLSFGMSAARPALYQVGIRIAKDNFPFGSGFGTFASSLSGEYYSSIYYQYNISNVFGLTPIKYNYMADTFWPYIYGQFGIVGLGLYIGALVLSFFLIFKRCHYTKIKTCVLIMALYLLFTCFVETIMTNESIILYMLSFYFLISYDIYKTKTEIILKD